jgi:hypothetical protein
MAARPRRTERIEALRLACWNAEGVRSRKLELENSLSQHGVDICLISETFLKPVQAFRLAKCVCHRTDKLTAGGGTAILVRRRIVHHSVRLPCLTHMVANCHPSHNGRQTGEDTCGLTFAFPPTERSGADRLFWRGIAGFDGRRPKRQTRGKELADDHETVSTSP